MRLPRACPGMLASPDAISICWQKNKGPPDQDCVLCRIVGIAAEHNAEAPHGVHDNINGRTTL